MALIGYEKLISDAKKMPLNDLFSFCYDYLDELHGDDKNDNNV